MRFKIDGVEWCKRLASVMPAVPAMGKAEKAWADGILLEADETNGGSITVTATDICQVGMKSSVAAVVERAGKALLPSKLYDVLVALQRDGEIVVDYNSEKKIVVIETPSHDYKGTFPCLDPDDFRVLGLDEDDSAAKKFSMPLETLQAIADCVAPSANIKDIETGKSGVLWRGEAAITEAIPEEVVEETLGGRQITTKYDAIPAGPSKLICVATDGKKLSKMQVPGILDNADPSYFSKIADAKRPFEKVPHFEFIVPSGLLITTYKSMASLVDGKTPVDISVFGGFITFRCGQTAVALRLLATSFANWRRVLSLAPHFEFIVGSEDARSAAAIANMSNLERREDPIILHISGDQMRIGNSNLTNDNATRRIKSVVESAGQLPTAYRQGLRYENFSAILNYIKTEYTKVIFSGELKGVLLQPCRGVPGTDKEKASYVADENYMFLVMPIKING